MSDAAFIVERANTVLYCAQWAATVAFYRETLRLESTFANDWFVEFQLGAGSFLSIADASRATIASVGGQGVTITLQVADVAAVHEQLQARGVELTPLAHRWDAQVCYCRDPEGHRIEFWSPDPR